MGSVEVAQLLLVHGAEVKQAEQQQVDSAPPRPPRNGHVATVRLPSEESSGRHLKETGLDVHPWLSLERHFMTRWRRSWCKRSREYPM